ncbi:MAG: D-aminoacyl-tRNA deacylase [Candidatus Poseidonia sp.]|nr:D-aminoacyl-tRNA deacylase [Poseidonia sp.]MBL6747964.1 D-aminoacyl-tRNA deacylase [Poseidonia sp.]MBL6805881.1 D-aminoacyl-tRNA deacylase [Poseidonia sp.]MBL6886432.1 D-aminoacyl-tRNA deacylase [Poseidonia sp.]MBL6891961.1 D-aminoacyl-tRNA deacylase [Poseidonia sp.]
MGASTVILIAVNQADIASLNQGESLRNLLKWDFHPNVEGHPAFSHLHLRMWYLPDGLLFEDYLDRRWTEATGELVGEVIFPSRHAATSGRASLTLHPIGVPHLPQGEQGPYGGFGGQSPPPNPRLASWWKLLLERAPMHTEVEGFDLSLEVTHHGPFLNAPALFIEVGSTEATWGHEGAANLLAELIRDGLLSPNINTWSDVKKKGDQVVLVTLGGGHYAPRANALAALDNVWLGHMLASYALPFIHVEGGEPKGTWKQAINDAITSTRKAFPEGEIVVSMDKKAFKGWQRQAVREHLEVLRVPLLTTRQIKSRLEGTDE